MIKLFNFANLGSIVQPDETKSFGVKSQNNFQLTSIFNTTVDVPAYAIMSGTVLLQQQISDVNKVNLILRPKELLDIKLPIKYIIYRGLKIIDFLENNNITDVNNKVKTTGTELLDVMQVIQQQRAPGVDIPVEALFGNDLSPTGNKRIDEFFFKNLAPNSQLFTVEGGIELGNYTNGEIGIEIVLENSEFFPTVEMAKKDKFEIDISGITDLVQKKWEKEQIRHFVDPVAFYGQHYDIDGNIEYRDTGGRQVANTKTLVYEKIQFPFATKNKVYLDIRNENGYSYNYYNNYVGTGTNADKELKIGQDTTNLNAQEYYTNGWPIHIVNIAPSNTANENEFYLALRINDNERPLLSGKNIELTPYNVVDPPLTNAISNRVFFTDETELLDIPIPSPLPEFTNPVSIKVPNLPGATGTQIATIVRLDYIKQSLPISQTNKFPRINFTDYLFGPIETNIPWDTDNKIQWFTNNHISYVDALNDGYVLGKYKTTILNIDISTNEIEIFDEVPIYLSEKVILENDNGNTTNEGIYTPQNKSFNNGKTQIKIVETIPSTLQVGDKLTLTVQLDGEMDYTNNKFISKNNDYSNLEVLISGNRLNFYSYYNFSNSFQILSVLYDNVNTNTEITFITPRPKTGFSGFVETGVILETDTSVGGSSDNDRLMFYASPINYFSNNGINKSANFGASGGVLEYDSILKGLEALMPGITIGTIDLKLSTTDNTLAFSYNSVSKVKELLFLLGLTKQEHETVKNVSSTALSSINVKLFRLHSLGATKVDLNGVSYYEYELQIAGLDNTGNYLEVGTGITIYTLDHIIFSSKNFAANYGIDVTIAEQALNDFLINNNFDEIQNYTSEQLKELSTDPIDPKGSITKRWLTEHLNIKFSSNYHLLNIDNGVDGIVSIILDFKNQLDLIDINDLANYGIKCKEYANKLYLRAQKIIRSDSYTRTYTDGTNTKTLNTKNKDAILYFGRLKMQVILNNHPSIINSSKTERERISSIFEKISRGLNKLESTYPDYSKYRDSNFVEQTAPTNIKKILISGFDPFGAAFPSSPYFDMEGHESNPAGNIVLALDGLKISEGGKQAIIRSGIFPVSYTPFDNRIIEDFFEDFILDDSINIIITFSYGIHYDPSVNHDFHIDRFAANIRGGGSGNNDISSHSLIIQNGNNFIKNTLPYEELELNNNKIEVPNFDITINHGSEKSNTRTTAVKILAKKLYDHDGNPTTPMILTGLKDFTNEYIVPSNLQTYITNDNSLNINHYGTQNVNVQGINIPLNNNVIALRKDNDDLLYVNEQIPDPNDPSNQIDNPDFVKSLNWDNLKYPAFENNYQDILVYPINGSGGNYLSNEIHYRVAHLRHTLKPNKYTGHIHVGFLNNQFDAHTSLDRDQMLEDIKYIIKKLLNDSNI